MSTVLAILTMLLCALIGWLVDRRKSKGSSSAKEQPAHRSL